MALMAECKWHCHVVIQNGVIYRQTRIRCWREEENNNRQRDREKSALYIVTFAVTEGRQLTRHSITGDDVRLRSATRHDGHDAITGRKRRESRVW